MPEIEEPLLDEPENVSVNIDEEAQTPPPRSSWTSSWRWEKYSVLGGPEPPVEPTITPWFKSIQEFPAQLHQKLPVWFRWLCLLASWAVWFASNYMLASKGLFAIPTLHDGGDSDMSAHIRTLSCGITPEVWAGRNDRCGLNGERCMGSAAFGYDRPYYFKCPANCVYEGRTFTPFPVGDKIAMRDTYVIGGDPYYRPDSFICASAVHAGIISESRGGCGVVKFAGAKDKFPASTGKGGFTSLSFDTEFPGSFYFDKSMNILRHFGGCHDLRWPIIWINFFFILAFGYFIESAVLFLYTLVVIGFWTVILASNPPWIGGSIDNNSEIISNGFRRLLPCLLAIAVIYHYAVEPQLAGTRVYLSRALFWSTAFFMGILENYVFGAIPIDRLTVSDLNSQAGAWVALIVVVSVVVTIVFSQAYVIWRAGKLKKFLAGYGLAVLLLAVLGFWPQQTLRIHHYILALFFLPGTGFQTTASLVYQGLLVGLFVAGVSRWDFDSILQTNHQLGRGGPEDSAGTGLVHFLEPAIQQLSESLYDIVLNWSQPDEGSNTSPFYKGYSLIINDVERYRGGDRSFNLTAWALDTFKPPMKIPTEYYVRIAAAALKETFHVYTTGPYTRAGIALLNNGTWTGPLAGMT